MLFSTRLLPAGTRTRPCGAPLSSRCRGADPCSLFCPISGSLQYFSLNVFIFHMLSSLFFNAVNGSSVVWRGERGQRWREHFKGTRAPVERCCHGADWQKSGTCVVVLSLQLLATIYGHSSAPALIKRCISDWTCFCFVKWFNLVIFHLNSSPIT